MVRAAHVLILLVVLAVLLPVSIAMDDYTVANTVVRSSIMKKNMAVVMENVSVDAGNGSVVLEFVGGSVRLYDVTVRVGYNYGSIIIIRNSDNVTINGLVVRMASRGDSKFSILIENSSNIKISNIKIDTDLKKSTIILYHSRNITIEGINYIGKIEAYDSHNITLRKLNTTILSITGSSHTHLEESVIENLIYMGTSSATMKNNMISNAYIYYTTLSAEVTRFSTILKAYRSFLRMEKTVSAFIAGKKVSMQIKNSTSTYIYLYDIFSFVAENLSTNKIGIDHSTHRDAAVVMCCSTLKGIHSSVSVKVREGLRANLSLIISNSSIMGRVVLDYMGRPGVVKGDTNVTIVLAGDKIDVSGSSSVVDTVMVPWGSRIKANVYIVGSEIAGDNYSIVSGYMDSLYIVGNTFRANNIELSGIVGSSPKKYLVNYNDFLVSGYGIAAYLLLPKLYAVYHETGQVIGPISNYMRANAMGGMIDSNGDGILDSINIGGTFQYDPAIEKLGLLAHPISNYTLVNTTIISFNTKNPLKLPVLFAMGIGRNVTVTGPPGIEIVKGGYTGNLSFLGDTVLVTPAWETASGTIQISLDTEQTIELHVDRTPPPITRAAPRLLVIDSERLWEAETLIIGIQGEGDNCNASVSLIRDPGPDGGISVEFLTDNAVDNCSFYNSISSVLEGSYDTLVYIIALADQAGNTNSTLLMIRIVPPPANRWQETRNTQTTTSLNNTQSLDSTPPVNRETGPPPAENRGHTSLYLIPVVLLVSILLFWWVRRRARKA